MDWTNDKVLEFLELVEKEPSIWNPKHLKYKNKFAINEAWERIRNVFSGQRSVDELKKKRNSLLTQYRDCIKKIRDSVNSDSAVYKPTWFAFDLMNRSLAKIYEYHNISNIESNEIVLYGDESEQEEPYQNIDGPSISDQSNIASTSPQHQTKTSKRRTTFKQPIDSKRRQLEVPRPTAKSQFASSTELESSSSEDSQTYANFLASKLRQYSRQTRNALQHEISHLLYQADNGYFQSPNYGCYSRRNDPLSASPSTEDPHEFASQREFQRNDKDHEFIKYDPYNDSD